QIPAIGQQLELMVADPKADQSKDRPAWVATQFDRRIAQLSDEAVSRRQVRLDQAQFAITQVAALADDEEGGARQAIQVTLEINVASTQDVCPADSQQAAQDASFVCGRRAIVAEPEGGWRPGFKRPSQMQSDPSGAGSHQPGKWCGDVPERTVNAPQRA